jgi:uncharacterized membrane protein YhiD involved in acid resistance
MVEDAAIGLLIGMGFIAIALVGASFLCALFYVCHLLFGWPKE